MVCEKCGTQLDSDSKFCTQCGSPVTAGEEKVAAAGFFSNKKNILILAAVAALILFGVVAALVLSGLPTTVYVDDFITIDYQGLSTQGTAEIGMNTDDLTTRLQAEMSQEAAYMMMSRLSDTYRLELTKTESLANGEEVYIIFFMDNEIAKEYGIQFKLRRDTVKVSGLQEPVFLDLFAELKLVYTGCTPYTQVTLENNSTNEFIQNEVFYYVHNRTDLEEGEPFTIEASYSLERATELGYVILADFKEYTASNLPQPQLLDPFDHVTVTFSGLEGQGRAACKVTGEIDFLSWLDFTFDKNTELSEGETVTLSYTVRDNENPLLYGYKLAEGTTRQYTVPKLGAYVTDFNQLSQAGQQQLIGKATEIAKLYLTKESSDNKTDEVHVFGPHAYKNGQLSYAEGLENVKLDAVIACQSSNFDWHTKELYFIFTVEITGHPNIQKDKVTGAFWLRITNPIVTGDGTLGADLDSNYVFIASPYVYLSVDALNTAMQNSIYNPVIYTPSDEAA